LTTNNQFKEVVWQPVLSKPDELARAKKIVELLCKLGTVTFWQESQSGYTHMAFHYMINGVEVRYLPHWGFYTVGMLDFDLPQTEADILATVDAYKILQAHGLRTKR
jgi:hypothetical protein